MPASEAQPVTKIRPATTCPREEFIQNMDTPGIVHDQKLLQGWFSFEKGPSGPFTAYCKPQARNAEDGSIRIVARKFFVGGKNLYEDIDVLVKDADNPEESTGVTKGMIKASENAHKAMVVREKKGEEVVLGEEVINGQRFAGEAQARIRFIRKGSNFYLQSVLCDKDESVNVRSEMRIRDEEIYSVINCLGHSDDLEETSKDGKTVIRWSYDSEDEHHMLQIGTKDEVAGFFRKDRGSMFFGNNTRAAARRVLEAQLIKLSPYLSDF
jgi:hypothetical protein